MDDIAARGAVLLELLPGGTRPRDKVASSALDSGLDTVVVTMPVAASDQS